MGTTDQLQALTAVLPAPTGNETGWNPTADVDAVKKKKNVSFPCRKSNTDFSIVQPVVEFLYRLSYRGASSPSFLYEQINFNLDSFCCTSIPIASGSNAQNKSLTSLSAYQLFSLTVITEQRMWKCLRLAADNNTTAVIGRPIHKQENGGGGGIYNVRFTDVTIAGQTEPCYRETNEYALIYVGIVSLSCTRVITPFRLELHRHFGGTYNLHLQGRKVSRTSNQQKNTLKMDKLRYETSLNFRTSSHLCI